MAFESERNDNGVGETPLNRFSNLRYHPAHPNGDNNAAPIGRSGQSKRKGKARSNGMEVRGPGFVSGAAPVFGVSKTTVPAEVASKPPLEVPQDEVEISAAGQLMGKLTESTDASQRAERLARIKAEIDAGTYDTDAKLEAALAKMFDRQSIDLEA